MPAGHCGRHCGGHLGRRNKTKGSLPLGPHSIRESGNGWKRVFGVVGAVEGGCFDGEKVRTSESGGGILPRQRRVK